MAKKQEGTTPVTFKTFDKAIKARTARERKIGTITKSLYVAGGGKRPRVRTKVVQVKRRVAGETRISYEIRLEIDEVEIGERAFPGGLESVQLEKRIPTRDLGKYAELLDGFAPDHLSVDPVPQKLVRPVRRIPHLMDDQLRYNTTIFGIDNRTVFQDTSYPWSAFGRCETNLGPFSGVMIGPRHLLTCNHGVDWTPPPGYAADWLRFTPAYYNGNEPFGSTYATHVYWIKKDNNDGFSNGDEDQYDYVVLVLANRIGDHTGWLGTRRYTDAWDGLDAWWHIGYPSDLTSMERPIYQSWFEMDGDDGQSDEHQAIYHLADVFPGQSGGPMFGFWEGDVGPRAVAVQSWQNSSTNGASGGGDLVDLAIRARSDHP
jgi:V8-like Glu-specific endopeptidase